MKAGKVYHCNIGRDKEILDLFKDEDSKKKVIKTLKVLKSENKNDCGKELLRSNPEVPMY
ncbi:MAG TPA: hypothetical protein VGK06_16620 [Methanosarcina sp.]|jgi:hypothetical protein